MPNPRRLLAVFVAALLVCWVGSGVVRAVGGGDADPPPAGKTAVKVERPKAEAVEGTAEFAAFRIKAAYGTVELDVSKVKSVTLEVEGEEVTASVELLDHSRMTGKLFTPSFPVTLGGKAESLAPASGLKLTFLHPKSTGLVAALIGLFTLTLMEIVLGVDNIIFLAIVAGKLPVAQQRKARRIGLAAALGTRLLLLFSLSLLMGATKSLFVLPELPFLHDPEARGVSARDLVLLIGGLFLIGKSTKEIREKIEHADAGPGAAKKAASFGMVILQIALIDIIFSLDSVITAVGMVEDLWVMITAMVLAVLVMVAFAEPISRFVDKNPSIKVLALSFLILIGVLLVAEGLGQHVDKGYIYFAMAFAVVIELINMRLRPKPKAATEGEKGAGI